MGQDRYKADFAHWYGCNQSFFDKLADDLEIKKWSNQEECPFICPYYNAEWGPEIYWNTFFYKELHPNGEHKYHQNILRSPFYLGSKENEVRKYAFEFAKAKGGLPNSLEWYYARPDSWNLYNPNRYKECREQFLPGIVESKDENSENNDDENNGDENNGDESTDDINPAYAVKLDFDNIVVDNDSNDEFDGSAAVVTPSASAESNEKEGSD